MASFVLRSLKGGRTVKNRIAIVLLLLVATVTKVLQKTLMHSMISAQLAGECQLAEIVVNTLPSIVLIVEKMTNTLPSALP